MHRIERNVIPPRDPMMMSETKRSQLLQIRTSKYNVNAKVDTNMRKPIDAVAKIAPPPPPPPAAAEPEPRHNIHKKPVSKGGDFVCYELAQRMNARLTLNAKAAATAGATNKSKASTYNIHNIQRLAQAKNVPKFEYRSDPRMKKVDVEKRARGCEIARLRIQTRAFDEPNADLKAIPAAIWQLRLRLIFYEKCGGTRNDANEELKLSAAREIMRKEFGQEMPEAVSLDLAESLEHKPDATNFLGAAGKTFKIKPKNTEAANTHCQKSKAIAELCDIRTYNPNSTSNAYIEDITHQKAENCSSEKSKPVNNAMKTKAYEQQSLVHKTKLTESAKNVTDSQSQTPGCKALHN